jgi:hypothetical protein
MHESTHPDNWQMSVWQPPSRPFHRHETTGHF